MKKTLLSCVLATAFGLTASAQLYDQTENQGTTAIISAELSDVNSIVQCADDFDVPAGSGWIIDTIGVSGFRSAQQGRNMTQVTVEFYLDDAGPTGSPVFSTVVNLDSGGVQTPVSDTTLYLVIPETFLPEGKYWVSVYGRTEQAERWNWYTTTGAAIGEEAVLVDYDDVFGVGATTWTTFTALGLDQKNLSFTVHGRESTVGIVEMEEAKISVYPNPTADFINVDFADLQVKQINIYSIQGTLMFAQVNPQNSIDVSMLAAGNYIIELITNEGIASQQFVKK